MKKRTLFLVYLHAVFAFAAVGQAPVSIEKEPMHRLKFENEFVRLFDVLVPVGQATKFHTHLYDGVSVRMSNAQIIDEVVGGEKAAIEIKYSEATFGARPSPLTHRVVNTGKTDFRNIFIEVLPVRNSSAATTAFPILSDGHVIVLNNARVRVNRLVLKPGEFSKLHTHQMHGLGIILYDSKFEISTRDGSTRTVESKAGDFVWQNAGTTHTIKNIGSRVFEAIDIEIK